MKAVMNVVKDVRAFVKKFGFWREPYPRLPPLAERNRAIGLFIEEASELIEAEATGDLVGVADAVCDVLYVTVGLAETFGIDLPPVWEEVHASNMRKTGGAMREDGKLLKPDGWRGPDVAGMIHRQIEEGRTAA